jgi:hypothetical protein
MEEVREMGACEREVLVNLVFAYSNEIYMSAGMLSRSLASV